MNWERMSKGQRTGATILGALGVAYLGYAGSKALDRVRDVPIIESSAQTFHSDREIVVQVSGAVRKPGLFRLRSGQRIQDAIEAAGGPKPDADLETINRAQYLEDGSMIRVPVHGDQSEIPTVTVAPQGLVGKPATSSGRTTSSSTVGTVSLNSATAAQLDTLPGVGPATAQKIIQYRQQNGGFRTIEEIMEVSGIGEKKFAAMRDHLRL